MEGGRVPQVHIECSTSLISNCYLNKVVNSIPPYETRSQLISQSIERVATVRILFHYHDTRGVQPSITNGFSNLHYFPVVYYYSPYFYAWK